MRHAIAVERGSPGYADDASRPLTDEGRKKLLSVCDGLRHLKLDWELIFTSPYVRARQTAQQVADYFEMGNLIKEAGLLTPGHSTKDLIVFLKNLPITKSVLLVGHEPLLSQYLTTFIFGVPRGKIMMKKAGLACIEFENTPEAGKGELLWLMTPKQIRCLG